MNFRIALSLMWSICVLWMVSLAHADVVYLKNGLKITGRIFIQDATGVVIDTKLGEMKIKPAQIDHVEQVSLEENYLKEGDALVKQGDLEKAVAVYQQGYEKTKSNKLKEKITEAENILAEKKTLTELNKNAEQIAQHFAEYKRLKNIFANVLALHELEAAETLDPNNQTVLDLLCQEYYTLTEKSGFTETTAQFVAVADRLLSIDTAEPVAIEYLKKYNAAMQVFAEKKAREEQIKQEQEKAEQERLARLKAEEEKAAPILDMNRAFYPSAIDWYRIVDSPLYNHGKLPMFVVSSTLVYKNDTGSELPQFVPIQGQIRLPAAGNYAKIRLRKKEGDTIIFGNLEVKGTMIPILPQLWDAEMLLNTKGGASLTDMKAEELLRDKTLEVNLQWETPQPIPTTLTTSTASTTP